MVREIPVNQGYVVLVDDDDFDWLNQWKWNVQAPDSRRRNLYARRHFYPGSGGRRKLVLMHRLLLRAPVGLQIDHVDRNPLNNQRSNLRLATNRLNSANGCMKRANTSGFRGVSQRPSGRWRAAISVDCRTEWIGLFDEPEQAAQAYDDAARAAHGPFAVLNFPEGR